jgi:hypothetical protein
MNESTGWRHKIHKRVDAETELDKEENMNESMTVFCTLIADFMLYDSVIYIVELDWV